MRSRTLVLLVVFWASLLVQVRPALALLMDKKEGKWNLLGKVRAEATFRTIDTPDNNPIPIEAGDMISQRNLIFLDWRHDLGRVTDWLKLSYYLQGRAYYDGAWDYGPAVLSDDDTRRYYLYDNRDQINDLKWDVELFQGYMDAASGPFFLRVGRQIVSWGEMSTLRVLDGINPSDNSSLAVDLLERMIPLFMVRNNMSFKSVGPFDSISLDGYYVPGTIDNTTGEETIDGSPIYPPIGRSTVEDLEDPLSMANLKEVSEQVKDDIEDDRFGVKLGLMIAGLDLSLAYQRIYSTMPVPNLDLSAFQPVHWTGDYLRTFPVDDPSSWFDWALGGQKLQVLLDYDTVDTYGGSFNYDLRWIETVFRGEIALYKNVPKMTPGDIQELADGIGQNIYLDFLSETFPGLFPTPPTLAGVGGLIPPDAFGVLPFSTGSVARFDVLKYGVGLDKWMKVPYLSRDDFMFIFEYVGSAILDYREKTIVLPWQGPDGETLYEPEFSNTFNLITSTSYLNGNLEPRLVIMYELAPNALSLIPSIKYTWRYLDFSTSYFHTISDSYVGNLGMLETRNEVSVKVTYNF